MAHADERQSSFVLCRQSPLFAPPQPHSHHSIRRLARRWVEIPAESRGQSANQTPDVALVDQRAPVHIRCGAARHGKESVLGFLFFQLPYTHHPSPRVPLHSISICRSRNNSHGWEAMMACALAVPQPAAALAPSGKRSLSGGRPPRLPSPRLSGKLRSRSVVAKVAQDNSESSGSIVKYVTSSFSTAEDTFALAGIGFAAVAALWASVNLIEIIDKLPVLPLLFELVGILVTWFFIYNNLLFKSKRENFLKNVKSSVSRIMGQ
ncbi:hypothetical protein BS78_03G284000 [Paspalum vaginatum]|nr:hypothetical protein BS78_03G284000 [Paspalum vaginatum]